MEDLSKRLKVRGREEYRELRDVVEQLQRTGLVTFDRRGHIAYKSARRPSRKSTYPIAHRMVGQLSVTRRGTGFVKVEGLDEEIVIAPKLMKTALNGDIVSVVPFARTVRKRRNKDNGNDITIQRQPYLFVWRYF